MKKNAFKLFIVTFILMSGILFSCKRNHAHQDDGIKIIKIETEDKRIGNPIKIGEVIPLETSKDCLVGDVNKAVYWNNRIILLDQRGSKALFIFDETGKLLFKTITGKGPGEVIAPYAFNINKRDTTILLYDMMAVRFFRYDFNGKIVDSKTITTKTNLIINDFYSLGKDTLLIFHASRSDYSKDEPRRTTWSLLTDELSKVRQFNITLNQNKQSFYVTNPAAVTTNQVLFVIPWCYDIYELTGTDYKIKYTFDFGHAAFSAEEREGLPATELFQLMGQSKKVGCLVSVLSVNDLLIIDAAFGGGSQVFLHSLTKGRTINLDNYIQRGLLPECRIWGIKEDGCLYALVEPEDLMKFSELHPDFSHLEITINSNPVLISFQIDDLF